MCVVVHFSCTFLINLSVLGLLASHVIITVSNYHSWDKMPFSSKLQNVPIISLRVNAFSDCTFPKLLARTAAGGLTLSFCLLTSAVFMSLWGFGSWAASRALPG